MRAQHLRPARLRPAARRTERTGPAQVRRQPLHRRDLPGRGESTAVPLQHPELAEFTFTRLDPDYPRRAAELATGGRPGPHCVIGGENYGQGSSREHAVITPRYLGLRAVTQSPTRVSTGRTWPTSGCCRWIPSLAGTQSSGAPSATR
ncbi:hypothetical protein [Streptomyces regalis]|uniref:hypothetical protein n=1 Tax=Streptomyces regalis TaxID=68262 RepID=UPI001FC9CF63|nr:hypothetical protein [Streptomyces regalis]